MKKNIFIFVLLLTLGACSSSEQDVVVSEEKGSYKEQICALNAKYSPQKSTHRNILYAQAGKVNGMEVAAVDVDGGSKVGAAVYHFTKNIKAALVTFAVAGAFCSYGEYVKQRDDSTSSVVAYKDDFFAVDLRSPIGSNKPHLNEFLPAAIGSKVGMYHNYAIAELCTNSDYAHLRYEASEDVFSAFGDILVNAGIYTTDDVEYMKQVVLENNLLETWKQSSDEFIGEQESVLISEFLSTISELNESSRYDYICQYMQIIDDAYMHGELSEESASLVNGAVSTWYYSHCLWNYYIPLNGCASAYMLETADGEWYITSSLDKVHMMLVTDSIIAVGIPQIANGHITEIYFFEDTGGFLETGWNVPSCYTSDYITISEVTTDIDINLNELVGTYPLQDVQDRNDVHYASMEFRM